MRSHDDPLTARKFLTQVAKLCVHEQYGGVGTDAKKNDADAFAAKSHDDDDGIESLYGYQSGTSMAAAIAAGAAARILSKRPEFGAEEIKGWIIRNATRGVVLLESSSLLVTANRMLRVH